VLFRSDFVGLYQITLNPLVGGLRYSWEPKRGVSVREFSHEQMTSNLFMDGVIDVSRNTRKLLRYRVGDTPEFDEHPGSRPIIEAGYSEFNVFPMQVITQDSSMFVVAVRREDGLPEDQFDACRRIVAPLARIVQSQMQTETNETLLATYLGKDAGARVSAGMVKRGDAEMIRAVVLFTDITGFTALSNRLPIDETVVILNRYFEALETPIMKNGGEVLKLMGDGMLAIFPTFDDVTAEEGAALSALSAVADAQNALADEEITFRSAYHIGEVHYGNIGGLNRLDFTAIGFGHCMPGDWKEKLDAIIGDIRAEVVGLRRHLHAHPEPSGEELQTSLHLYQLLGKLELDVRMGPDGCGEIGRASCRERV